MKSSIPSCPELDADRVAPGLYQGSYPRYPVRRCGIQTLVLCAAELQQERSEPGLEVLYCPLHDETVMPMSRREWLRAYRMAQEVARRVKGDQRVLVTCAAGLNRSGLVVALALHFLTGAPGKDCVEQIQRARPGALYNRRFVEQLNFVR